MGAASSDASRRSPIRRAVGCALALALLGCGGPATTGSPAAVPTGGSPAASPGPTAAAIPAGVFAQRIEDLPFRLTLPSGWTIGTPAQNATFWAWIGEAMPDMRAGIEDQVPFGTARILLAYDGTEADARNPSLFCDAIGYGPGTASDVLDGAQQANVAGISTSPTLADGPTADRVTLPVGEAVRIRWREAGGGSDLTSLGYAFVVGQSLVTCVLRVPSAEATARQPIWDSLAQSFSAASQWHVTTTMEVGIKPFEVAVGGGYVWVANAESSEIARIDPATNRADFLPIDTGPAGQGGIFAITFERGRLWVTAFGVDATGTSLPGSLVVIDTTTGSVERTVGVGRSPTGLANGFGAAWVANLQDDTTSRVDEATFKVTTIEVPGGPTSVAAGPDAVWVASSDGTLTRIDPATNATRRFTISTSLQTLTVGSTAVWATDDRAVYAIDPTTGVVIAAVDVAGGSGLVARDGTIWVSEGLGVFVHEIDEATATITDSIQLATNSWGIAELDGSLWVVQPAAAENKFAESKPGTVTRLDR